MASERTKFRDVLEFAIGGGWGSETRDEKNTVPVAIIRGTDFAALRDGSSGHLPRRFESPSKVSKRTLRAGDIILEVSGGSPTRGQTTGRTCFIDENVLARIRHAVIPASFCRLVRVDRKKVLPRFAYYWLQDMYASGRAGAYENQSTGISNFQFERFLDAEALQLPSLVDQQNVVEALGAIDGRIDNLRQTNAILEAIAQAVFKSWFVDFDPVRAKAEGREPEGMDAATAALFPSEFEDSQLGSIPKGWRVDEISRVVNCMGGATPSTKDESFWASGTHHWATPKDLSGLQAPILTTTERLITDAGIARISSGLLPAGTLLMSSRAPIGYLAVAAMPTAINQGFIAMPPGGLLPPSYLLFWASTNMELIKQKANGSTFMEISKAAFRPIKVCVPPSEVIRSFSAVAEPLLRRIELNEHQKAVLIETRDTLLPRLISGKLRLPEAEALIEDAIA